MKNFRQPADTIDLTAPVGGVVSGNGYKIGQIFGVAARTEAAGNIFPLMVEGAFDLPKTSAEAHAEGALVYWDDTAKKTTTTSTGNLLIGISIFPGGSANPSDTGRYRLNGHARPNG